jgi:hypothetical protein
VTSRRGRDHRCCSDRLRSPRKVDQSANNRKRVSAKKFRQRIQSMFNNSGPTNYLPCREAQLGGGYRREPMGVELRAAQRYTGTRVDWGASMRNPLYPPTISPTAEQESGSRSQPVIFGEACQLCQARKSLTSFSLFVTGCSGGDPHSWHKWEGRICEDCSQSVCDGISALLPGAEELFWQD